jgi:hypothetical protein
VEARGARARHDLECVLNAARECLDAARETMVRVTLYLVVSELVRDKPQQKTVSLWTDGLEFLAQLERLSSS